MHEENRRRPTAHGEGSRRSTAHSEVGRRSTARDKDGKRPTAHDEDGRRPIARSEGVPCRARLCFAYKQRVGNKLQKKKNTYRDYSAKDSKVNSKKRTAEGVLKQAEGLVAESLLALQQTVECNTLNETKDIKMNPMTAKSFGMIPTEEETATKKFDLWRIGSRSRCTLIEGISKKDTANKVPSQGKTSNNDG